MLPPIDPEVAPKALNDVGHLASGVGHHVINAFSAIVSNAELLRIKLGPNAPPVDPAAIADIVIDTAMEASTVARRLIDYTRPLTAIGEERLALDRLVGDFVEARKASDPGVTWSTRLEPVPPIRGRVEHLEFDARLPGRQRGRGDGGVEPRKELEFSTSVDGRGWVMLEIRDSGRGMEPETLEQAVEPFFTTKGGRLGVGLSIANGIWRRHRGTLSLRSRPDEGTVLRLCVEPSEP